MRVRKGQDSIKLKCYTLEKVIVNDGYNGYLLQRICSGKYNCNGKCGSYPQSYQYDYSKIKFCCPFKSGKNVSIYFTNMEIK